MKQLLRNILERSDFGIFLLRMWRAWKLQKMGSAQPSAELAQQAEELLARANANIMEIPIQDGVLLLQYNNTVTHMRGGTFFTKEPETLAWIDAIPKDSVLWDIGANIGIYSLYAAKTRDCTVFAFEPSIFNLELLGRNIFINKLHDKIHIIPVALSATDAMSTFTMGNTAYGGALSAFGVDFGYDGKPIPVAFQYSMLGLTGDTLMTLANMELPDYIKIDVDGIEHYILQGMQNVLRHENVKSVLVEGNDDFFEQAEQIRKIMHACGYHLAAKEHSAMFDNSAKFSCIYNQTWNKSRMPLKSE